MDKPMPAIGYAQSEFLDQLLELQESVKSPDILPYKRGKNA